MIRGATFRTIDEATPGHKLPVAARMFTMRKPLGAASACSQAVLSEGERGSRRRLRAA